MKKEPAVAIGAITSILAAVLALLVSSGVSLTAEQQTAIVGLFAAVSPVVASLFTRPRVSPIDKQAAITADEVRAPSTP